jgi:hypothetical protein
MPTATVEPTTDHVGNAWRARRVLWAETNLPRLRNCGRAAVSTSGGVMLRYTSSAAAASGKAGSGFAGLQTCGSVWSCPCCASKIAAERQVEVATAIRNHQEAGGAVAMVTLTMRHHRSQSLRTLWAGLAAGWARVASGGAWKSDRHAMRQVGFIKATEVTHGASGWHVHLHVLLFLERELRSGQLEFFAGLMFDRWSTGLRSATDEDGTPLGIAAPIADRGGLDVRPVGKGADALGAYFAKATYDQADRAAMETTRGAFKTAKGANRTPFQILRDVVSVGLVEDLDLWHEYETASKGRRQLTWSKGLRERLGVNAERTDEEIAADDHGGHDVVLLPPETWAAIAGDAEELLYVTRNATNPRAAAVDWLESRGLVWLEPDGSPPARDLRC